MPAGNGHVPQWRAGDHIFYSDGQGFGIIERKSAQKICAISDW